jgi:hypothetical protein
MTAPLPAAPTPWKAFWTPEAECWLRTAWDAGMTMTEIGRRLGCSKNAVSGKSTRLGLIPRPSPVKINSPSQGCKRVPLSEQDRASATALLKSGRGFRYVAKKLHVGRERIARLMAEVMPEKAPRSRYAELDHVGETPVRPLPVSLVPLFHAALGERCEADASVLRRSCAVRVELLRGLPFGVPGAGA